MNKVKDDLEKINITLSYIEGDKVSDFVQNIYDRTGLKQMRSGHAPIPL